MRLQNFQLQLMNASYPHQRADFVTRFRQCLPLRGRETALNCTLGDLALDSLDVVDFLCSVESEFRVRLLDTDLEAAQTLHGLMATIQRKEARS